jgi:hypothetical protein
MEAYIDDARLPLLTPETSDVRGQVTYDTSGDPMEGVTISYTIKDVKGSTTTNINGDYMISVPSGAALSDVRITEVSKRGYIVTTPSTPPSTSAPLTPSTTTQDFVMSDGVEIDNVTVTTRDTLTDPTRSFVEITFDVTNNLPSTAILSAGSGWSRPTFEWTTYSGLNYAVIPLGASGMTIKMKAYYDSQKFGAGSEDLSVMIRDLLGNVLQTTALDVYDDSATSSDIIDLTDPSITMTLMDDGSVEFKEGTETIMTVTAEGNRISKHEYGFAMTFTSSTDRWIQFSLSVEDLALLTSLGWYASLVDADNVKLDNTVANNSPIVDVELNGNSVSTYYVRLISTDGNPDSPSLSLPAGMFMGYGASGATAHTDTMELDIEPTNLSAGDMSAEGENIFDKLAGMPTIVWVFAALSILMMLLIFWLGMRRGVFLRRR